MIQTRFLTISSTKIFILFSLKIVKQSLKLSIFMNTIIIQLTFYCTTNKYYIVSIETGHKRVWPCPINYETTKSQNYLDVVFVFVHDENCNLDFLSIGYHCEKFVYAIRYHRRYDFLYKWCERSPGLQFGFDQ